VSIVCLFAEQLFSLTRRSNGVETFMQVVSAGATTYGEGVRVIEAF
jgi:hypothetical protein